MSDHEWVFSAATKLLHWGAKRLRERSREDLLRRFRLWVSKGIIFQQHRIAHALRDLSTQLDSPADPETIVRLSNTYCGRCSTLMQYIFERSNNPFHCTLKVFTTNENGELQSATMGRSETSRDRPNDVGLKTAFPVSESSVFASLVGGDHSVTPGRVYVTFCCNDLTKHDMFRCPRDGWIKYYRATLVYPLRWLPPGSDKHQILGCLTFDTPMVNGFPGMPDIFECEYHSFHDKLTKDPAWHAGAVLADGLAALLAGRLPKEQEHASTT